MPNPITRKKRKRIEMSTNETKNTPADPALFPLMTAHHGTIRIPRGSIIAVQPGAAVFALKAGGDPGDDRAVCVRVELAQSVVAAGGAFDGGPSEVWVIVDSVSAEGARESARTAAERMARTLGFGRQGRAGRWVR